MFASGRPGGPNEYTIIGSESSPGIYANKYGLDGICIIQYYV